MNIRQLIEKILFPKKTIIGVDLEPTFAAILLLHKAHQMPQLSYLSLAEIPKAHFPKGVIQEPEALGQALQAKITPVAKTDARSAIAIPAKLVTSHTFKIRKNLSPESQEKYVNQEVAKVFPDLQDELYTDFTIKENENTAEFDDIMIVAAHKKAVQDRLDTLKYANLPVKILDVDYYALERGFELLKANLDEALLKKNVALIDLSSMRMLMTVYNEGELIHFYHHSYYIEGIDRLIRYHLHNTTENKEDLKKLDLESDQLSASQQQQFINQVQHVLKTFAPENYSSEISLLFLSGGCTLIPEIKTVLEKHLGVSCELANPFKNMLKTTNLDPETLNRYAPACVVAAGLAMRNITNDQH